MTPFLWFMAGAIVVGGASTIISSVVISRQVRIIRHMQEVQQLTDRLGENY